MITVVVIAFNRPDYLKKVVESLRQAEYPDGDVEFILFNDGPNTNGHVKESIKAWGNLGQVFDSTKNLFIVGNYRRAEEHVFRTLGRESAYFIADDCYVAPHYFKVIADVERQLGTKDLPFVNSISGWGQYTTISSNDIGLCTDMNMLSYGGSRYERWRRLMQSYYDKVEPQKALGVRYERGTSQDVAKMACVLLSLQVRIKTLANYCIHCGEQGVHCTRDIFQRAKMHTQIIAPYVEGLQYKAPNWLGIYAQGAKYVLNETMCARKIGAFQRCLK